MRPPATRHAGALRDSRAWYRYWIILGVVFALSVFFAVATLEWDNPMPVGSEGFWLISKMRLVNLFIILIVAFCQILATVSFQTITNNRIITPSIIGFESLYVLVQTGSVCLFGAFGLVMLQGTWQFVAQLVLMVTFAALLY